MSLSDYVFYGTGALAAAVSIFYLGRYGLIGSVVVFASAWIYRKGRKDATAGRADAMRDRKNVEDEIAALGPADLDSRYSKWLRRGR